MVKQTKWEWFIMEIMRYTLKWDEQNGSKKGISYREMEESGIMLPVVSMSLNYKKSALYDDVVKVKTQLKKTPAVRIEFDYEITNQAGEILVQATTVLAFIDMKTKRPIKCPDYILGKLTV